MLIRGPLYRGAPESLTLSQKYVPLRGRARLEFSVIHSYEVWQSDSDIDPRQWETSSAGYSYQVREIEGSELIAFHWHPGREHQPDFPHVHITGQAGMVSIQKQHHIPTGRVSLESVVRFAIEELGVRPLRPDWDRLLAAGQAAFDTRRTW